MACWNSPNEMKPSPFLSKERKRSRELDLRAAHCLLTVSSNALAHAGVGRGPCSDSADSLNLTWKLSRSVVVLTEGWPCSSWEERPSACSVDSPKPQCWSTCVSSAVVTLPSRLVSKKARVPERSFSHLVRVGVRVRVRV